MGAMKASSLYDSGRGEYGTVRTKERRSSGVSGELQLVVSVAAAVGQKSKAES